MNVKLQGLFVGSSPAAILARLIAAPALLLPLAIHFAIPLALALLPLYRMLFELIAGDYRILFFGVSLEGADSVIRMDVTLAHAIAVAGRLVMADPQGVATVTTMLGNIFQPFLVGLITVLAWPSGSWRIVLSRLIFLILFGLFETVLDIPLLLAGELWGLLLDNLSPGSWSALSAWADFLQGGGCLVMGLIAAIASIAAAGYATKPWGDSK